MESSLFIFLLSAVAISLSGVLAPGPVFTVAVAKGHRDGMAGAWIGVGHGLVEFPLMAAIYFGFGTILSHLTVRTVIALLGGAVLIYMGQDMIRARNRPVEDAAAIPHDAVTSGLITSAANPYFLLWWATVGASLIERSLKFGLLGFLAFAILHWLCDFSWYLCVSMSVNKTRRFWSPKAHKYLFLGCGILLLYFGLSFIRYAVS